MGSGLAGCGDSNDDPGVKIVNPEAGTTTQLGSDMKVRLTISANDFSIQAQGSCGGDSACGQAYVNIDGNACNQPGRPFNNMLGGGGDLGQDFFVEADFSLCPAARQAGTHTVTVSLHRDDGTAVIGSGGQPAAATISLVTTKSGS
jgi:hypothetical protein